MEPNPGTNCYNCSKPLPQIGYFCGRCLTQVRCKSCNSLLEKEDSGCINCGAPKEVRAEIKIGSHQNVNTFRLHETVTDRTIEATFSDDVAKDLAGTLRDAAAASRMRAIASEITSSNVFNLADEKKADLAETRILSDKDISSKAEAIEKPVPPDASKPMEYPSLIAVAMNNLPSSETEWIVVYGFYASKYGKEIFTRENILDQYKESNRYDKQTTNRDLSYYIKRTVIAGFINPLQSGYSLLPAGAEKAKEIVSRTSSSSPNAIAAFKAKKRSENNTIENGGLSKKKVSKPTKTPKRLTNLNFEPTGKEHLKDFIIRYKPKNDFERNLLFVYYLQNVLEITEITFDHIYSCYDILGLRISENLPQTIRNTASKTGWVETKNSILSITIKGSNQIKEWDKKDKE